MHAQPDGSAAGIPQEAYEGLRSSVQGQVLDPEVCANLHLAWARLWMHRLAQPHGNRATGEEQDGDDKEASPLHGADAVPDALRYEEGVRCKWA